MGKGARLVEDGQGLVRAASMPGVVVPAVTTNPVEPAKSGLLSQYSGVRRPRLSMNTAW